MRKLIETILAESEYQKNPYFVELEAGNFSKDDFVETQIQFQNAVAFFNRPMAILVAKIPAAELRVSILRNVWEEHGEGDPAKFHNVTFNEFLLRLGNIKHEDTLKRALWPEVRIFNTTLTGACLMDEYLIGVGLYGIIERMFCEISPLLGKSIVKLGWLRSDQMIHYDLHEILDVRHSEDFFDVLKPSWNKGGDHRYYIEQGLRMGAELFNGLYESLYRHRARRLFRDVSGPHTRA